MYLTDVEIKNFKGIENMRLELQPGFNLIKGENGKGKTSILEALAVGLGGFIAGIDGVSTRHFTKDEIRKQYTAVGDASCSYKYCVPVEVAVNACFKETGEIFSWVRTRNSVQASRSTLSPRNIAKMAEELSNNEESELPVLCYQAASRVWSQKREKSENIFHKKYVRTVGYTDTLQEASNIKLLLNWCVKMEQVAWQKEKPVAEYEAVKKTVSNFMRQMNYGKECRIFYDKQMEELMYQENELILPVMDLSAGFQSLIWMVFDIAYRMAVLNPFLGEKIADTNGVVLIDELDMHLHPKWQWEVIDALRKVFPNVQFIATTHAPILFASAKNVWIIDIENGEPEYGYSHYGIDVNTSINYFQKTNEVPEEIQKVIDLFCDEMDEENYSQARKILDDLEKLTAPQNPILAKLRTRYEIETAALEE
ncbi:MAG TPA: AAA family ATPase [Candidatus Anaerobutyricum faecale]|nr:AAA family ATPase [Candidatus Anaerobutyricum faecale]